LRYGDGADRRPLSTTPPTVPITSINAAPPSTANSEPEPPEEARDTAPKVDPREVGVAFETPPPLKWAELFDVREPAWDGVPKRCATMPAPKSGAEDRPPPGGDAPVWRA